MYPEKQPQSVPRGCPAIHFNGLTFRNSNMAEIPFHPEHCNIPGNSLQSNKDEETGKS